MGFEILSLRLTFFDRADKEKGKFQQEVYELLAQVDSVTKEKILSIKTVEKLEIHVSELNVKIEELNRTIVDITSHKTRLSQENIELTKEVQDLKVYKTASFYFDGIVGKLRTSLTESIINTWIECFR